MAVVAAVVKDVVIDEGPSNAYRGSVPRIMAKIYVTNGATQVAGGTDTLDIVVQTVLRARLANLATYTVRSFCVCQTGFDGTDEMAATISNSAGTLSLVPKTIADWSTNDTIAASTMTIPYGVIVYCDVS